MHMFARVALVLLFCSGIAQADSAWLEGYANHEQLTTQLKQLADEDRASLASLGKTAEGRDVWVLTVGRGDVDQKPGVLVMGAVQADEIFASELAVEMAKGLLNKAGDDEKVAKLLDEVTFYFIPRPSPDATERLFASPYIAGGVNSRSTDADRDGATDEDPSDDLNGDGVYSQMRVADPTGEWIVHPDDPRIMIRADRSKGEIGKYRLLTEGIDNDNDEKWNEDGPGGVDFNKNFTFEYPFFGEAAGPHQVSEPETRAVADFAFGHGNIFMVLSIAPQQNLIKPWAPANNESGRIKTKVLKADVPYFKSFADAYGKKVTTAGAPSAASEAGSFVHWAYFHYGRWSLATPGWWIPKVEAEKTAEQPDEASDDSSKEASEETEPGEPTESSNETAADEGDKQAEPDKEETKKPDTRAADEVNALAWFDKIGREGFIEWQTVDHPDFAGKQVEVGGFHPLSRLLPPHDELLKRAGGHVEFLIETASTRPQLAIAEATAEELGGGVVRIKATAINHGPLPTMSAMGNITGQLQRLELAIELPKSAKLLSGTARYPLAVLKDHGGNVTKQWLIEFAGDPPNSLKLTLGTPSIGFVSKKVEINVED